MIKMNSKRKANFHIFKNSTNLQHFSYHRLWWMNDKNKIENWYCNVSKYKQQSKNNPKSIIVARIKLFSTVFLIPSSCLPNNVSSMMNQVSNTTIRVKAQRAKHGNNFNDLDYFKLLFGYVFPYTSSRLYIKIWNNFHCF